MSAPTPDQLQAILRAAAERLGTTPEHLADTLDPATADKVNTVLRDREKLNTLLNSPQAQALLKQLLGGN